MREMFVNFPKENEVSKVLTETKGENCYALLPIETKRKCLQNNDLGKITWKLLHVR